MWVQGKKKAKQPQQPVDSDIVSMHFKVPLTQRVPGLQKMQNTKLIFALKVLIGIVLIAGLIIAVRYYMAQNKVVLRVGDYTVTQRRYDRLLDEAKDTRVSKTEARKSIVSALASRAAADKLALGFELSEDELDMNARQNFELTGESKATEFQKMVVTPDVVQKYVSLVELGGYQAAVVEFPFSRYILGSPTDKVDASKVGNLQEISSDIAYAKQQYEKYQTILDQKQMTPQDVVNKVKSDSRLIYGQVTNPSEVRFISDPGTDRDQVNQLDLIVWQDVKAAAEQLNRVKVTDVIATYPPSEFGVGSLSLQSGEGTRIGWRLTYVMKKVDKQQGITQKYKTLIKEFSGV